MRKEVNDITNGCIHKLEEQESNKCGHGLESKILVKLHIGDEEGKHPENGQQNTLIDTQKLESVVHLPMSKFMSYYLSVVLVIEFTV
jgi:hypothetical protein